MNENLCIMEETNKKKEHATLCTMIKSTKYTVEQIKIRKKHDIIL